MTTTHTNVDPIPRRALLGVALGAAGVGAIASRAAAGPLDPPAGPVSSTGKTLAQIEPRTILNQANTPGDAGSVFRITQPGSYYLTGPVSVPAGKVAFRIEASNVTIDLGGFRVSGGGVAGTGGVTDGGASLTNITICNGIIEGMGGIGVFLLSRPCRLVDLVVQDCMGIGILTADRIRLERVTALRNATSGGSNPAGILVGSECVLLECVAEGNTGPGLSVGAYTILQGCRARLNTKEGIIGGATCVVTGCTSSLNGAAGFSMQHSATYDACTALQNTAAGFSGTFGSVFRQCAAQGNGAHGFVTWEGCVVAACAADNNTGDGYNMFTGNAVRECVATTNSNEGFNASTATGSSIHGCVARGSGNSGIRAQARCLIHQNDCSANCTIGPNAAGIRVDNTSCLVVGNNSVANGGYGVWVTGVRGVVVRNGSAQNNTNWSLIAGTVYGPVINRVSPGSQGMLGNGTVASTLGSSDPFANFSF